MRKYLLLLSSLIFCAGAYGQGVLYQLSPPAPNARVLVCPSPDNGYPCPTQQAIYSDPALTQVIAQPVSLGSGGFFSFYVTSGTYTIQLTGPGYGAGNRQVVNIGGGGASAANTNPNGVFNASFYGVTAAGSEACDATFTNGSPTLTITASDKPFTSAMVGWTVFGTASCVDGLSYTQIMPIGTILSVTSGTVATASVNANASAAGTATQHLIYMPIEDTQLTAAETAAFGSPGNCPLLNLPAGIIGVKKGHFNTFTCNSQTTGATSNGANINGAGRVSTRLMMTPDFDFTTCPSFSNPSLPTCFGAAPGITKQTFGITGGQHPGTNPAALTCIVNDGIDDFSINIGLFGMGSTLNNVRAYCMTNTGGTAFTIIEDGMGSTGGYFNAAFGTGAGGSIVNSFFGNNAGVAGGGAVNVSGGNFDFIGTGIGQFGTGAASGLIVASGAFVNWVGGTYLWNNNAINGFECDTGSVCNFEGVRSFGTPNTASNAFYVHGGKVTILNSIIRAGASANGVFIDSNGIFTDGGGNNWSTGTAPYNAFTGNATVYTNGVSTFNVAPTLTPTCVFTSGGGTSPSCTVFGTNEQGVLNMTTGTGSPGTTGTMTMTFKGVFAGGANVPSCAFQLSNAGGAWSGPATVKLNAAPSTTAIVEAWDNNAVALTVSTAYQLSYVCKTRP